jgi:hypothetical protein
MSSGIDPERSFKASDIEASLKASLDTIYGPCNPLADGVISHAMGSLALGLKRPEVAEDDKTDKTYAERLRDINTPEELKELALDGAERLRKHIASYLNSPENGTLSPYIYTNAEDKHAITGELWIYPQNERGRNEDRELHLRLEGGTSYAWDPLGENHDDITRYEHSFAVKYRRVYDPLSSKYVEVPYVHTKQELGKRFHSKDSVTLEDSETYALREFSSEYAIVHHVLEHLDYAIDWYENVYSIAPNGISYGKIKELGYVDANGELLPNWFELMAENHRELMWPEEHSAS